MNLHLKRWLLVAIIIPGIVACASTPPAGSEPAKANIDPYEGFNRAMFRFNNGLDSAIVKPVTKGYRYVTPDNVETGVSNFFSNLLEIRNIINSLLQGKGDKTLTYTGRFIFNSTFGLFGILDVATPMGLETKEGGEDFGQTLAAWGVKSGPYLVLPIFGPSTLRDGLSIPIDSYADPINHVDDNRDRYVLIGGKLIDTRAGLLDSEELLTGDRYVFIRNAYLQRREFLIRDGKVVDTFGGDLDSDNDF